MEKSKLEDVFKARASMPPVQGNGSSVSLLGDNSGSKPAAGAAASATAAAVTQAAAAAVPHSASLALSLVLTSAVP
jgi:hypothetical protein